MKAFEGKPERFETRARTLELKGVRMGSGSLAERLEQGQREGRYRYVDEHIAQEPDFAVKETRPTVDIVLLSFPDYMMTIEYLKRWLAAHPEYNDYELATPEYLDALDGDSRLAQIAQKKTMMIVAPGASTSVKDRRWVAHLALWKVGDHSLILGLVVEQFSGGSWFALVRKAGT